MEARHTEEEELIRERKNKVRMISSRIREE